MKYFCSCNNEVNLKEDRVPGKYSYECKRCGKVQKKKDLRSEAQIGRKDKEKSFDEILANPSTHPCSSCDEIVSIHELDGYGRCQRCQEEYGEID